MSYRDVRTRLVNSASVTAVSHWTLKPADRSTRRDSSMSDSQSSKKSTRRGVFRDPFSTAQSALIANPFLESRLGRRLVHHQPVTAELFDSGPELGEIH